MRALLTLASLLVVSFFGIACSGDLPTQAETTSLTLSPSFAAGGNSGCYTVKFATHSVGAFPFFPGTQTGDIDGSHLVAFAGASTPAPTGVTWNFVGTATFVVTGGIIPELVGKSFVVSVESRNVFNDPDLFAKISNLKTRAISGVQKANLTGRGETASDASTVDATWNGVICP
jgi:hypothetical protein